MADENTTGDLALEYKPVYKAEDDEFYHPLIDAYTRANANMDYNHHEIHEGNHYFVADYITIAGLAVGNFVIEVGAVDVHFVYAISSDIAGFSYKSFEGVSADEDGTIYKIRNNNRGFRITKPTTSVLRYNPSNIVIPDANDWLRRGKSGVGGTAAPQRVGGSVVRTDEVILYRGLKYLLQITNLSADSNDINVSMMYYHKNVS